MRCKKLVRLNPKSKISIELDRDIVLGLADFLDPEDDLWERSCLQELLDCFVLCFEGRFHYPELLIVLVETINAVRSEKAAYPEDIEALALTRKLMAERIARAGLSRIYSIKLQDGDCLEFEGVAKG
jgi:hypothetical protein